MNKPDPNHEHQQPHDSHPALKRTFSLARRASFTTKHNTQQQTFLFPRPQHYTYSTYQQQTFSSIVGLHYITVLSSPQSIPQVRYYIIQVPWLKNDWLSIMLVRFIVCIQRMIKYVQSHINSLPLSLSLSLSLLRPPLSFS